jgi:hypothetical protein
VECVTWRGSHGIYDRGALWFAFCSAVAIVYTA